MSQELLIASAHGVHQHFSLVINDAGNNQLNVYITDVLHGLSNEYQHLGLINHSTDNAYIFELINLLGSSYAYQIREPLHHPNQFILDVHSALKFDCFEEQLIRLAWCKFGYIQFYQKLNPELLYELYNRYGSLYQQDVYSIAKKVSEDSSVWNKFSSQTNSYDDWDKVIEISRSNLRGRLVTSRDEWLRLTGQEEGFSVVLNLGNR